jgi:hypothetical protein
MLRLGQMPPLGIGLALYLGLAACTQDIVLPEVSPAATGTGTPRDGGRDVQLVSPGKDAPADSRDVGVDRAPPPDAEERCQQREVTFQHPRVILALDRSASMQERPAAGGTSRLHGVQHALETLMRRYFRAVYFGYVEFPVADCPIGTCCASEVVPPARTTLGAIQRRWTCELEPASCQNTTKDSPVAEALMASRRYFGSRGNEFDQRHVFLMTDGEPACSASVSDDECTRSGQEAGRLNTDHNVDVTVFALSESLQTSACVSDLASFGGTGAPIVAATNDILKAKLEEKLAPLAKEACSFRLNSMLEESKERLYIWLNGVEVKRDPTRTDGWDFEAGAPTKVTFYGPPCTKLSTSLISNYFIEVCRDS